MSILKFEKDQFYMHEYQQDTIIEVLEVKSQDARAATITICYWNLGYTGRPWKLNVKQKDVLIPADSFNFWHNIDYDLLTVPRFRPGMPRE